MAGLLDIIGQALSMPTALAQQKVNLQQSQLANQMSQAQMAQLPQFQQTMSAINAYLNGGDPSQGQPPQQSSQQPSAPSLASGAIGLINAAHPSGAVLPQPASTSQSPTGPVSTYGVGNAPASQPMQPPGLLSGNQGPTTGLLGNGQPPQQAPQQSRTPDPMTVLRYGVQLQGSPLPLAQTYGKALTGWATTQLANDPANQTRLAEAKSTLAQDALGLQQAQASGDQQAIRNWQIKALTDAGRLKIPNNGGGATLVGGGDVNQLGLSSISSEQGTGVGPNGMYALPGATRAKAAIAGAVTGAQSANEYVPVFDSKGNQTGYTPRGSILSQAPSAPSGSGAVPPTAAPSSGGSNFGLGPQTSTALADRAKQGQDYLTTTQKASDDATTANYALDNVISASRGASLGPGAPAREYIEKQAATLSQIFGGQPPPELSNYQELDKYGNQLGFATARTMGSREAAQIVTLAIQSNPNKSLTPAAFGWIANSMKAMNNYQIAKNTAIQAADQRTPGSAQQAGAQWNSAVDPRVWDLSLDPGMAATLAPKIGAATIAKTMPLMGSADAVSAFRNIPPALRAQVLAGLPPAAKAELAQGLQQ